MRPLLINFLTEPPSSTAGARWLRRLAWSVALLALLANFAIHQRWQDEHRLLKQQLERLAERPAGTGVGRDHGAAAAAMPSYDPMMLTGIDRSVRDLRRDAPEAQLRLDSLWFDGRLGKLTLHGQSLRELAISQLRAELVARFPQAKAGFPSLQGGAADGRPVQFEIGLQLAPPQGISR